MNRSILTDLFTLNEMIASIEKRSLEVQISTYLPDNGRVFGPSAVAELVGTAITFCLYIYYVRLRALMLAPAFAVVNFLPHYLYSQIIKITADAN